MIGTINIELSIEELIEVYQNSINYDLRKKIIEKVKLMIDTEHSSFEVSETIFSGLEYFNQEEFEIEEPGEDEQTN